MADLVDVFRSCDYAYFDKFHQILGGFWTDARTRGDLQRIDDLRRGMRLLRDINVAVHVATNFKDGEEELWSERVKGNPLACDRSFHEFLDGRALFAAKQHHPSAEAFGILATQLRYFCRVKQAMGKVASDPADSGGFKKLTLPSTPEQAELWFAFSPEFSAQSLELAKRINERTLSLEDAIATIVHSELPEGQHLVPQEKENAETARPFVTSAFLEHVLLEGNAEIRVSALQHYRELLKTGHWSRKDAEATFVLRYAKAVVNHWRYVPDQQNRLQQTADLISETLPTVDPVKSPRLTRDLWFWKARLLENVGIWDADAYEDQSSP